MPCWSILGGVRVCVCGYLEGEYLWVSLKIEVVGSNLCLSSINLEVAWKWNRKCTHWRRQERTKVKVMLKYRNEMFKMLSGHEPRFVVVVMMSFYFLHCLITHDDYSRKKWWLWFYNLHSWFYVLLLVSHVFYSYII